MMKHINFSTHNHNSQKKTQITTCTQSSSDQKQSHPLKSNLLSFYGNNTSTSKISRNNSIFSFKDLFNKKLFYLEENNQKCNHIASKKQLQSQYVIKKSNNGNTRQALVDQVVSYSTTLLDIFYKAQYFYQYTTLSKTKIQKLTQFNKNFTKQLQNLLKQIKLKPKQLSNNLNTIYYSIQNIKCLPLPQIYKQILVEWKQNILLTSIRNQWYRYIQQQFQQFTNINQFFYFQLLSEQFCSFMSHLTFYIFKQYFRLQIQNKGKIKQSIKSKLSKQTMKYLITQPSQWRNKLFLFLQKIIIQHYHLNNQILTLYQSTIKSQLLTSVLKQISIPPLQALFEKSIQQGTPLFKTTAKAIDKFNKQHYIFNKIQYLKNIRAAREHDILCYQKQLLQSQHSLNLSTIDKDHLLSFLLLSILSNNLHPQSLAVSIGEVKLVLGQELDQVLGVFKCPSYFSDLQAIMEFFEIEMKKNGKQNHL